VSRDHRELTIELLADSEATLRADLVNYRELVLAAIHQLHAVTRERDRIRAAHHRLLEAYRSLRTEASSEAA
jgi:hypothetical protein